MSDIRCISDTLGLCSPGSVQIQRTGKRLYFRLVLVQSFVREENVYASVMTHSLRQSCTQTRVNAGLCAYKCVLLGERLMIAPGSPSRSLSLSGRARGPVSDQSPRRRRRLTGGCLSCGHKRARTRTGYQSVTPKSAPKYPRCTRTASLVGLIMHTRTHTPASTLSLPSTRGRFKRSGTWPGRCVCAGGAWPGNAANKHPNSAR